MRPASAHEWSPLPHYAPPAPPGFAPDLSPEHRRRLEQVCALPELALLTSGLALSAGSTAGARPFEARDGRAIIFSPEALRPERCRRVVREAAELCLWQRLAARRDVPPAVLERLAAHAAEADGRRVPTPREGMDAGTDADALFRRCSEVAVPVELLLTTGGDSRLQVDPATGLNRYGCSPRPRPWAITFASCTATSISAPAYAWAEALRQRLMEAALEGRLEAVFRAEVERVRTQLARLWGVDAGTKVILTTSGTDAELFALQLALRTPQTRVTNIVVGPQETGSNVGVAAAGRHFDGETALAVGVEKGALLEGLAEDQVRVVSVPIRTADGQLLPAEEVDRTIEAAVAQAVAEGRRALLHVLDTSKTGLVVPGSATVRRLRERWGDSLDVVVDACQLRLSHATVAAYLEAGCLVLVTGSKFFTGPPFAGALLVPARLPPVHWMLPGLSAYSGRSDWPADWTQAQATLTGRRNLGLLLRWEAVLWEMEAFRAVPPAQVRSTLTRFLEAVKTAILRRPFLTLLPVRPIERADPECWDALQTIFTFIVRREDGEEMTLAELKQVHEWLNQDISTRLDDVPADEQRLAARCCHIAQPIVVDGRSPRPLAALRFSAGARLVSDVAFSPLLGPTERTRLESETADALLILDKLDVIVRRFEMLSRNAGRPRGREPGELLPQRGG